MLAATKRDMQPFEPQPSHHSWPLFHQDWWLDATAPKSWRRPVTESSAGTLATFPFVVRRRFGLTALTVPPLTPYLGPWIRQSAEDASYETGGDERLLDTLISNLPPHDILYSVFLPEITSWLSFSWHGIKAMTRYTYRLSGMTDLNAVWRGFTPELRRQLRRAERTLTVRTDLPVDAIRYSETQLFEHADISGSRGYDILSRIDVACHTRDQGRMLVVEDRVGRIHGVVYAVWDDETAYVILGNGHQASQHANAWNLLIWELIRYLAPATQTIDFAGSVPEEVCWSFGASRVPYLVVSSTNSRARLIERVRVAVARLRGNRSEPL